MSDRPCPWWMGYALLLPFRRWVQDPRKILGPHLMPGMTVLEPGPGMGYFTLDLARFVGPGGRVIAVEPQGRMLDALRRRVLKAGLGDRVETRSCIPEDLATGDLSGKVDFVLAFAVAHETPDVAFFFQQIAQALKRNGKVLLAEPTGHVGPRDFAHTLSAANLHGLRAVGSPRIRGCHTALLRKA